ncbi:hypothetical protein VP455E521_P0059 [Vibrio phage 455E52-1]|nr:hypothetical protein VP455E521_P0059 [Vibrio phage 455E52-1]
MVHFLYISKRINTIVYIGFSAKRRANVRYPNIATSKVPVYSAFFFLRVRSRSDLSS